MSQIAVLIPTYNAAQFIGELLDSIEADASQCEHLAVYVFDDCSTDNTVELVNERKMQIPLRVVRNERNLGECENVNRAMAVLTQNGIEWTVLFHQDDLLLGPWLSYITEAVQRCSNDASMICCHNSYAVLSAGIQQHDVKPQPAELRYVVHSGTEESVRSLRRRWFWTVSGTVVRTDAYTSIGGMHPHLLYAADNDFLCRFLLAGHGIVEVDWPVILKRYST